MSEFVPCIPLKKRSPAALDAVTRNEAQYFAVDQPSIASLG